MPANKPGYSALRKFRHSAPETKYFLTLNLAGRTAGLEKTAVTRAIMMMWNRLEQANWWTVRTAVVMPYHLHLLVRLGREAPLADCLRRFKGGLVPKLRRAYLSWQNGFYEHRMRDDEDRLSVFLYIFLNPYRAGLLPQSRLWAGYHCAADDWKWFEAMTDNHCPMPEWLR